MNQPDLIPMDRTQDTITVRERDLDATLARVRALGGVVLGFSVKGATYTLSVLMPPGELLAEAVEGER